MDIQPGNREVMMAAGELRPSYVDWCQAEGIEAITHKTRFADAMKMNGFESTRHIRTDYYHGKMVYYGMSFKV